jgi:hypothetical protein
MPAMTSAHYLTPPDLARRYRCKPSKIIAAIRSGELVAIDLAAPGSSRPRYRISPAAIEDFERRRAVTVLPRPIRRRRSQAVKSFV